MKLFYINILVLLCLSGCTSITPYHELGFMSGGGYTDYDISTEEVLIKRHPNSDFLVVVMLNKNSKLARAKDYAHRRAAELTIEKGYDYYTYIVANSNYTRSKWEGGGVSGYNSKPDVRLAIKFHNTAQENSKNAKDVIENFMLKYKKETFK